MELSNDVTYETMVNVLNFVYTGSIENLTEEKADLIHKFATKYTMIPLIAAMEAFQQKKLGIVLTPLFFCLYLVLFDTFMPTLSPLLDSNLFSDVIISLDNGKSFYAHKCILGSRSPYMLRMFKSGKTVRIDFILMLE